MSHLVQSVSFEEFIDKNEGRTPRNNKPKLAERIRGLIGVLTLDLSHHSVESAQDVFAKVPNEPPTRGSLSMSLQRSSQ